jgi:hypothetical protein
VVGAVIVFDLLHRGQPKGRAGQDVIDGDPDFPALIGHVAGSGKTVLRPDVRTKSWMCGSMIAELKSPASNERSLDGGDDAFEVNQFIDLEIVEIGLCEVDRDELTCVPSKSIATCTRRFGQMSPML